MREHTLGFDRHLARFGTRSLPSYRFDVVVLGGLQLSTKHAKPMSITFLFRMVSTLVAAKIAHDAALIKAARHGPGQRASGEDAQSDAPTCAHAVSQQRRCESPGHHRQA